VARHVVRFAVSGETLALLRDARIALTEASGERPDDDALIATLCRAVLDRGDGGAASRARHQIALTICEACDRAWQDGGGQAIEVAPEVVERARCDAQHLGRVDAAVPARATQDISPSVRRQVWRRDHRRCVVPGCRSTRFLDLHHIEWRRDGGDHSADNLCLTCTGHHRAIHEGRLVIRGRVSTGLVFLHADGRPYGAPPPESVVPARPIPQSAVPMPPPPQSAVPMPPPPETAVPMPPMPETPAPPPPGSAAPMPPPPESAVRMPPMPEAPAQATLRDVVDAIRRTGYSLAEARAAVDVAVSHVGSNAELAALIGAAFAALHPRSSRDRPSSGRPRPAPVAGRRPWGTT
jgi:hypothetical protein